MEGWGEPGSASTVLFGVWWRALVTDECLPSDCDFLSFSLSVATLCLFCPTVAILAFV